MVQIKSNTENVDVTHFRINVTPVTGKATKEKKNPTNISLE